MRLLTTGGFRGGTIQRRHFWLQSSKGRCHGNEILAKIDKNITKMAITSVVCNISMQSLVLRYGCTIGEFVCDTPVHKRQRGVTMATNFATKVAINAYKCISTWDSENVIIITGGFRGRPIQRRHFWLQGSKDGFQRVRESHRWFNCGNHWPISQPNVG